MKVLCFFFFQAEDGIRDTSVTGVQTCALPISQRPGAVINARAGIPAAREQALSPRSDTAHDRNSRVCWISCRIQIGRASCRERASLVYLTAIFDDIIADKFLVCRRYHNTRSRA